MPATRGLERPTGARNWRTEARTGYILGRFPSPLILPAKTLNRPVRDLVRELWCSLAEVFRIQLQAAERLAL